MSKNKLEWLTQLINVFSYRWSNEDDLQTGIEKAFAESGVEYSREHRLSKASRVDFFVDGIAVEVKVHASTASVLRQMHRYAEMDDVCGLLLVTPSLRLKLPPTLCDKPAAVCRITRL